MKKIVIIGCGFAGLSAALVLSRYKQELEITVIDKGANFNFPPLLPDAIGRGIRPDFMAYPIDNLRHRYGFLFVKEKVKAVDTKNKKVISESSAFDYDFLVIASGSETNFYGNEDARRYAYKLGNTCDVKSIRLALEQKECDNYLVAGGGYTGIEVATNLRIYLNKKNQKGRVIIVELSPDILGPLPQWMKDYVKANLKRMGIEVFLKTSVEKTGASKIELSGGKVFEQPVLFWSAGVKTSDFISNLEIEKSRQGRAKVDDYLKINDSCFVIGDAADFSYKAVHLRMAVQFSIVQGEVAAQNILRSIRGKRLKRYRPIDLGFIIPMANNLSCGRVMGINVQGRLATLLHYLICIYRSYGLRNKFGILKDLIFIPRI